MKLLNRPYPYPESLQQGLFQALTAGIGVAFILGVLGPFEISSASLTSRLKIALGFGAVTTLTLCLLSIVYQLLKSKLAKRWNVGRAWASLVLTFTLIGLFNFLYAIGMEMIFPSWKAFGIFQFFTWSVGLIPASILLILQHNRLIYKNLQQAKSINAQLAQVAIRVINSDSQPEISDISFYDEKQRLVLQLKPDKVLVLSASDNYTEVWSMSADGVQRILIRGVLRQVAQPLENHDDFMRVHRSYWLNVSKVKSAEGNAQGMLVEVEGLPWKVPISRSQVPQLRAVLSSKV